MLFAPSRLRVKLIGLCLAAVLGVVGCSLPQWRIFQKTVPSDQSGKPSAQTEGEKRGAKFIQQVTTPPVNDPAKTIEKVHEVATGLSASLGEPSEPVKAEDYASIIQGLRVANAAKDKQLEKWKAFGRKYGGTPLEGTGINLAGPAGLLGLLGVIALCIACPAVGYAFLRVIPVLWGYFRQTTAAVSEYAADHPDAAANLARKLSNKMALAQKLLIRRTGKTANFPQTTAPAA